MTGLGELRNQIRHSGLRRIPEEALQTLVKVGDVVRIVSTYLNAQQPVAR